MADELEGFVDEADRRAYWEALFGPAAFDRLRDRPATLHNRFRAFARDCPYADLRESILTRLAAELGPDFFKEQRRASEERRSQSVKDQNLKLYKA